LTYNNKTIEIVSQFTYLGSTFRPGGAFRMDFQTMSGKRLKAMHDHITVANNLNQYFIIMSCHFNHKLNLPSSPYTAALQVEMFTPRLRLNEHAQSHLLV
jgi:hypothetical protein